MKLKTLKDLEIVQDGHYYLQDLKQEAIKWIKHIEKDIEEIEEELFKRRSKSPLVRVSLSDIPQGFRDQITWIKMFFNITEEDLK